MFVPKRVKHRKWHKCIKKGNESRGTALAFGNFGLKAMESARIDSRQLEASRRAMARHIQKGGKIWIRIFPNQPITKKPPEVTMGGGKGDVDHYVFQVLPGRILFEIDGVSLDIAKEAMRLAANKLPIKTKFINKI